jgi:hypothetical protein
MQSNSASVVEAFAAYRRIVELWNNYGMDKWKSAAETKFLALVEVTGCDTPKAIKERIEELYTRAQEGKWQGEAIRKLLLVSKVMKERGIL